jgi:hypothetical protein
LGYNTYIYTWKCHNATPGIVTLNKKNVFSQKNGEQEGKTGPVWGLIPVIGEKI